MPLWTDDWSEAGDARRALTAQAVWVGVESPLPIHVGSVSDRGLSPHPPSTFWTDCSQLVDDRMVVVFANGDSTSASIAVDVP